MTKRILVIDDEQPLRRIIQISLEELSGWQVVTAESGDEGLEVVQNGTWDVILLDVSMPGMDGVSVFQALQANPATQAIPVVLLTAKVLPSDRRRFAEIGVAGVITKPFDPVTVGQHLAKILGW